MQSNYLPILCGAGLVILVVPLSILAMWLTKKGWMSVRLIAISVFLTISPIGIGFWFFMKDGSLALAMLGLALLASLSVLSMPVTNPSLMKLLKLKW